MRKGLPWGATVSVLPAASGGDRPLARPSPHTLPAPTPCEPQNHDQPGVRWPLPHREPCDSLPCTCSARLGADHFPLRFQFPFPKEGRPPARAQDGPSQGRSSGSCGESVFFLKTSQKRPHWSPEGLGLRARKPSTRPGVWLLGHHSPPLTAPPRPTPLEQGWETAGCRLAPCSPQYIHWGTPADQDKCPSAAWTPAAGNGVRVCSWHARVSPSPWPHPHPCCGHWDSAGPTEAHPSGPSSPGPFCVGAGRPCTRLSTLHRPGTGLAAPNPGPRLALACQLAAPLVP
ncbi:PREDICTED: uncharacterized protein LOC109395165 [Hipposideros armiger]|uniref:Uncharacterized protein LOC109395165 n=1 Tax=Hipposideros armiger TaxID=186990 RepID=A0A8B7TCA1_HIPAR|nr:PREDICTED: uncharacterized protein LOC109395165 [Hipposideros armiger]